MPKYLEIEKRPGPYDGFYVKIVKQTHFCSMFGDNSDSFQCKESKIKLYSYFAPTWDKHKTILYTMGEYQAEDNNEIFVDNEYIEDIEKTIEAYNKKFKNYDEDKKYISIQAEKINENYMVQILQQKEIRDKFNNGRRSFNRIKSMASPNIANGALRGAQKHQNNGISVCNNLDIIKQNIDEYNELYCGK